MSFNRGAKRPIRSLLAVALITATAAVAAPALAAGPYSQTVFFGDSLTDSGFFRPLLPASVRPVTGQFTTNPGLVWSQYLADFYGTGAVPNGNTVGDTPRMHPLKGRHEAPAAACPSGDSTRLPQPCSGR